MKLIALVPMLATTISFAAAKRPIEGNPESTVRVVIFEDLQCPDCAALRTMLDQKLLPKYAAKVAFEHRDFPLAKHAFARKEAVAARFVDSIDSDLGLKFRRDALGSIKQVRESGFDAWLANWAKQNSVDPAKAAAALEDKDLAALVEKDFQDGVARGVAKTPTAFVNGVPFIETFTFDEISKAIEEALKQN